MSSPPTGLVTVLTVVQFIPLSELFCHSILVIGDTLSAFTSNVAEVSPYVTVVEDEFADKYNFDTTEEEIPF